MPWLSTLMAVPAVGAVAVAAVPKRNETLAKQLTFAVSLVVLALAAVMAAQFNPGGDRLQFTETYSWIPSFGIHFALGVDGVALVLILLSALLVPIVVLASWNEAAGTPEAPAKRSVKTYFALILVLEAMMIGVFAATDVFLFYVFFEAMLIPMYFMIGSYGGAQRSYAAVKFLLYSLLGGLLMLVAVIGLYVIAGKNTFLHTELIGAITDPGVQRWLFLGFFIAFAIKAPLVPFHTWLPDSAAQAPAGAAVLLVGVLDKVGTYGMLRFCLELFPDASRFFTPLVITLAVIGIIYGAIVAIGQTDIKRLIAYTSISHFGFIAMGVFAMTTTAGAGATLYMVNHGFATGALFLVAGFLIQRRGSQFISDYGGVQKVTPVLAGSFLFACLAGTAVPGLATFVSEFTVLIGTFQNRTYLVAAVIATFGVVLSAIYMLWLYQRVAGGPPSEGVKSLAELNGREKWVMAPLIAVILALGVYPKPLFDVINPSVTQTLSIAGVSADPEPTLNVAVQKGAGQ
ncbi:NADH-quinone oxidoreductase subunit M [Thermopolyspora flexuosa]|uniref:NADH dehydrogenase subunit M n=1 Tax=Thermopolyspora flexuosa TaxID=103836 RepID=A0A543J3F0_9ACTN|nr:NADH-quinone oxidoreductase subunit M [Thermopolyspora flexuosa]TQM77342.1 NADH dehydrogenase subunit M [Thermopolyspora flexuosa]GGM74087.1 NADH-quinone oxidoreductase subunit M [Thermopolyspora flexuosa]